MDDFTTFDLNVCQTYTGAQPPPTPPPTQTRTKQEEEKKKERKREGKKEKHALLGWLLLR